MTRSEVRFVWITVSAILTIISGIAFKYFSFFNFITMIWVLVCSLGGILDERANERFDA